MQYTIEQAKMNIDKSSKIGVICGGISSEREISLRSGLNCFNALTRKGYINTRLIDIKSIDDLFLIKEKIEVAFLTTHGKYGEDGCIQGILEWLKIPYTGSSPLASAISMNKWITKHIARAFKIPTPNAEIINEKSINNTNLIWQKLSCKFGSVFLKPIDDGSSVNTYKVKSLVELNKKISELLPLLKQNKFMVEECIEGKELTVSIIEKNNKPFVLPILELKPKNEFYDYEAKYTKGLTEFILPAKINDEVKKRVELDSITIFNEISCSGFARADYILGKDNIPYLLEVNSLPGMTDTSDLPAQAACEGINYDDLVELILKTARVHKSNIGLTKQSSALDF